MNSRERPTSEKEDAAVAALVLLHRRRQERARKHSGGSEYQRVVAHFERRAQRLRGERLATAELVERLLGARDALPPPSLQRELELRGPARGTAAGRLRLRNASALSRGFELSVGEPLAGARMPEVRLDPQRGTLAPNGECWCRVEVSLPELAAGSAVTLPIHCHWEGGRERIWLVVRADGSAG